MGKAKHAVLPGLLLALLLSSAAVAQLSGTYTIDPSKPPSPRNFQSLGAAVAALTSGVSGPVVFKVASTTFTEQITLFSVGGASSTNTITFEADGAPAVIRAPAVDPMHCVRLRGGARWYRFKNLKLAGYIRSGLYLETQFTSTSDNVFERLEIDDGGTAWPAIRAVEVWGTGVTVRNQFKSCIFRAVGKPVEYKGSESLFDRCEFDGKGVADPLFSLIQTATAYTVVRNCFFHDCGPAANAVELNEAYNLLAHNTTIVTTSGSALWVRASVSQWRYAPILRNNVLVNLGSGSAIQYAANNSQQLYRCDSDSNCLWAPNSVRTVLVGWLTGPFYAGSLASFLQWQKGPGRILPGGATAYEPTSVEVAPGLGSLTKPHDIHLTPGSPLLDRGTTSLVPSYSSAPPTTVTRDFEGDVRVAPVDIGADEASATIDGTGTGAVGTTMLLGLRAQFDAGLPYQVGTSLGTGPIFIGPRKLGLNFDALFVASVSNLLPGLFGGYAGVLDGAGRGQAKLNILNDPGVAGVTLYSAFVTIHPRAPQGIQSISNTFSFTITR